MQEDTQTAEFSAFWAAYPRREARKDALKAWQQTAAVRPPVAEIIRVIRVAIRVLDWTPDRRRFIPLPATWLRGERWNDELEAPIATSATAGPSAEALARQAALEKLSRQRGEDAMQRLRREQIAKGVRPQLVRDAAAEPAQIGLVLDEVVNRRRSA